MADVRTYMAGPLLISDTEIMYCKRPSYGSRPQSFKYMVYKKVPFAWRGENWQERQFVSRESSPGQDEWWSVVICISTLYCLNL